MSDQKTTRPLSGQLVPGGGYAPLTVPVVADVTVHTMNNGSSAAPGNPIVEHISLWLGNKDGTVAVQVTVEVDGYTIFPVTIAVGEIVQVFDRIPFMRASAAGLSGDIVLRCVTAGSAGAVAFGHYTVG